MNSYVFCPGAAYSVAAVGEVVAQEKTFLFYFTFYC